jgi:hypothetical protein
MLVRAKGFIGWNEGNVRLHKTQANEIPNFVRNLLWGIHRDECFKPVELKDGEVKRDMYLRFFQSGWDRFHQAT